MREFLFNGLMLVLKNYMNQVLILILLLGLVSCGDSQKESESDKPSVFNGWLPKPTPSEQVEALTLKNPVPLKTPFISESVRILSVGQNFYVGYTNLISPKGQNFVYEVLKLTNSTWEVVLSVPLAPNEKVMNMALLDGEIYWISLKEGQGSSLSFHVQKKNGAIQSFANDCILDIPPVTDYVDFARDKYGMIVMGFYPKDLSKVYRFFNLNSVDRQWTEIQDSLLQFQLPVVQKNIHPRSLVVDGELIYVFGVVKGTKATLQLVRYLKNAKSWQIVFRRGELEKYGTLQTFGFDSKNNQQFLMALLQGQNQQESFVGLYLRSKTEDSWSVVKEGFSELGRISVHQVMLVNGKAGFLTRPLNTEPNHEFYFLTQYENSVLSISARRITGTLVGAAESLLQRDRNIFGFFWSPLQKQFVLGHLGTF